MPDVKHLLLLALILLVHSYLNACDPPTITGNFILCANSNANLDAGSGWTQYNWSDGGTNQVLSVSEVGTYTVTVTDGSGCTAVASQEVVAFTVSIQLVSEPSGCDGGTFTYEVTAANVPNFPWALRVTRGTDTGNPITNLYQSANFDNLTYPVDVNVFTNTTFTLTESFTAAGCDAFLIGPTSFQVNVGFGGVPPTIVGGPFVCVGSIPEPTTLTVTPAYASYLWSTGETTQSIDVSSGGIYSVTVTDALGNVFTEFILISEIGDLGFFLFGDNEICPGGEAVINAFPDDEGEINWSTGEMGSSITVTEPGTYSATITRTCQEEASFTVNLVDGIDVEINGPTAICAGNSAVLSVDSDFETIQWSTGESGDNITVNESGEYSVTVSNGQGCDGVASIFLDNTPGIDVDIIADGTLCEVNGAELSVSGTFSGITWSTGESTNSIQVNLPGDYSVTVTDADGCTGESLITVDPGSTNEITLDAPPLLCEGASGSVTVDAADLTSVLWSTGDTNPTTIINGPGTYSVTVTDISGCETTGSITIQEESPPEISISGEDQLCPFESGELTVQPSGSSVLWSTGDVSPSINVTGPGFYEVTVTFDNQCTSEATFEILESTLDPPTIDGPENICPGQSFELSVPDVYDSYLWSNNATGASTLLTEAGTYDVIVTLNGCDAIAIITITETDFFEVDIMGSTSYCGGESDLNLSETYDDITWSTGETSDQISISAPGVYSVTVTDPSGCQGIGEIVITDETIPPPDIQGNPAICSGSESILNVPDIYFNYQWNTGSTGSTTLIASPGFYSITVTNVSGCTAESSIEIIEGTPPDVFIEGPDGTCPDQPVSLTVISSTDIQDVLWSNGSTLEEVTFPTPGVYEVTITDANGCTNSTSVEIATLDPPIVEISGNIFLCEGQSGTLTVDTDGETILWSTGEVTPNISISAPGEYLVTVTDANQCSGEASIIVLGGNEIDLDISGPASICAGGEATLSVPAGFTSYLWSTGSTNNSTIITEPGDYSVTLEDESGCNGTASITVTLEDLASPDILQSANLCPDGVITLSIPDEYDAIQWNTGDNTPSIEVNEAGTYTVEVIDASGCEAQSSIVISEEEVPELEIAGPAGFCPGEIIELTVSGPEEDDVLWSTGETSLQIEVSTPGLYSIEWNLPNGCTTEATVEIQEFAEPMFNLLGSATICPGSTGNLRVEPEFESYQWSQGSSENNISINAPGTYEVTVTDINGCTATSSREITESNELDIEISTLPYSCDGIITLNGGSDFSTYIWSTGETTSTIQITESGTYSLEVEDASGCSGETEITVEVPKVLELAINGDALFCPGESGTLFVEDIFESYLWSTGDIGPFIDIDQPGTYELTAEDGQGCVYEATFSADFFELSPLDIGIDGLLCTDSTAILFANESFAEYLWSDNSTGSSLEIDQPGTYDLLVTDFNGCIQSEEIEVSLSESIEVTIEQTGSTCQFSGVTLSVSTSENADILWNTGQTDLEISIQSAGLYSVVATSDNLCPGSASIVVADEGNASLVFLERYSCDPAEIGTDSLLLQGSGGCDSLVIVDTYPGIDLQIAASAPDQLCEGNEWIVEFNLEGLPEATLAVANDGMAQLFPVISGTNQIVLSPNTSGTYSFALTDLPDNICTGAVGIQLFVEIIGTDSEIRIAIDSDSLSYQLSIEGLSGESTVLWSPAIGLSCTTCPSPIATPETDQTYIAEITQAGCTFIISVSLVAITPASEPTQIYFPTAFSPNGDGINDKFTLFSNEFTTIRSLMIYDRWGNLMYREDNLSINDETAGWDGRRNGQILQPGVYIWTAVISNDADKERSVSGEVTLLR